MLLLLLALMNLVLASNGLLLKAPVVRFQPSKVQMSQTSPRNDEEFAAAKLVETTLIDCKEPTSLNSLVSELPDLKAYLMAAPIRLVPLLQLFPEKFALLPTEAFDGLQVSLTRKESLISADADAVRAAVSDELCSRLLHYHSTRSSNPTDPVPLQWLVRTMSAEVELLVACATDPSLLFHLEPERFGYSTRWAAWWSCVNAHVQSLVASSESTFVWHVIKDDAAGESYAVSLTPVAVQQRARQREEERALKRTRRRQSQGREQTEEASAATFNAHQQRAAAKAGAQRAAVQEEEEEEEDPIDLLELPEHDESASHLIVLRGASRTGRVFEQELLAAAQYFRVRKGQLRRAAQAGLWLLDQSSPAPSTLPPAMSAAACRDLLRALPLLASVRIVGTPIASAPSAAAMMARLADPSLCEELRRRAFGGQGHNGPKERRDSVRWTLRLETHFPQKESRALPFHPLEAAPELSLALHGALGGRFVSSLSDADEADEAAEVNLILLQTKVTVILLRSLPLDADLSGGTPSGLAHVGSSPKVAPLGSSEASSEADCLVGAASRTAMPLRLPPWVTRWEDRGFAFSSALDPLVAIAAVNMATYAHLGDGHSCSRDPTAASATAATSRTAALRRLRIFDPCVGSGTVLAAAASLGFVDLCGCDLRADFVEYARINLDVEIGAAADARASAEAKAEVEAKASLLLQQQDATAPLAINLAPDGDDWSNALVVSNPPWGKNVGDGGDGEAIIRSITSQCAGATFCWVANSRAIRALDQVDGMRILRRAPLGAVELVVCKMDIVGGGKSSSHQNKGKDGVSADEQVASGPGPAHKQSAVDSDDGGGLLSLSLSPELSPELSQQRPRDSSCNGSPPPPPRILVCGDADFAYSRALAARLSARGVHAQISATGFESEVRSESSSKLNSAGPSSNSVTTLAGLGVV